MNMSRDALSHFRRSPEWAFKNYFLMIIEPIGAVVSPIEWPKPRMGNRCDKAALAVHEAGGRFNERNQVQAVQQSHAGNSSGESGPGPFSSEVLRAIVVKADVS